MLLEFGAYNFASFKEGFQINLREKKNSTDAYTLMGIKGANASGKTNVLKVLSFLSRFTRKSFSFKNDQKINFSSFFNNDKETSIYAIVSNNGIEYKYEIDLTVNEVIKESIYRKGKLIIERIGTELTKNTHDEFKDLKSMIIRQNVSIISTAKQYGSKSIEEIYDLFRFHGNVHSYGLMNEVLDYKTTSEFYHTSPYLLEFLKDVLKKTDTGISDVLIKERINEETKEKTYYPIFKYEVEGKGKFLTYMDQSSGTKALFIQLCLYKLVLNMGGVLVLDELDINLHPDLIPVLLNFFESEKLNPNKAQLIFATHNTEIMDRLKKNRTVIVNNVNNESHLYKIDELDISIRNDRSISKLYETGRLGGKPKIRKFHEE